MAWIQLVESGQVFFSRRHADVYRAKMKAMTHQMYGTKNTLITISCHQWVHSPPRGFWHDMVASGPDVNSLLSRFYQTCVISPFPAI